ncbi:MAG: hypothetical protein E7645_05960 [Ruminococcaceae bacterium]|nr:hypothetical protein [Oscillospiraceae bacterium]
MTDVRTQANKEKGRNICTALRTLTVLYSVLGPVAMLLVSAVTAGWDLNAFWFYLVLVEQMLGTVYLSLVTLLWELTRHVRRRAGEDLRDTPFAKGCHLVFLVAAIAGLVTIVVIPLILADLAGGPVVLIHYAFGGVLLLLYVIFGVYTLVSRTVNHRRAERQRLEEEKQAWEGYLN